MEARIQALEAQVRHLRAQNAAHAAILQGLLAHFSENEHTATYLAASAEGNATGHLLDATMSDETAAQFMPLLLALLPEPLQTRVRALSQ